LLRTKILYILFISREAIKPAIQQNSQQHHQHTAKANRKENVNKNEKKKKMKVKFPSEEK
jgi:hypothetical protein